MKFRIRELVEQSLESLLQTQLIPAASMPSSIAIEHSRREGHGDFATAIALGMAKKASMKPREIAELIREHMPESSLVEHTEIAGPGFINFFLTTHAYCAVVAEILENGDNYGSLVRSGSNKILIEFVSANPTGPLHVGHGRGAAYGDTLARIMHKAGYSVDTEYYVNDIGRQMSILTLSTWVRYLQIEQNDLDFPKGAYRGDYVVELAKQAKTEFGELFVRTVENLLSDLPDGEDAALDQLVGRCQDRLGDSDYETLRQWVLDVMVEDLRDDLKGFGVEYDQWFAESQVVKSGEVEHVVSHLKARSHLYESDGALWFRSTEYGDEKDRVVVRSNNALTYFASDIAYHLNKYQRGYNMMINIWGADHHGYIARMKAVLQAAGEDPEQLIILLVQFASLYRKGVKISMSTRAGEFVSLRQLREEIGEDAARFFYVSRKSDQHLEFDLDLAKSQSNDNPVYYIQYAHARIASIFRQMRERGVSRNCDANHSLLERDAEISLMKCLARYPEVIESSASALEPHQIAYYLRELANEFHSFYNKERVLDCEQSLRDARLDLLEATRQVLSSGLNLIGVSAPDSM